MPLAAHLACPGEAFGTPVCRLGLAFRGTSVLDTDDVLLTLESGVNFLNWPGRADHDGGADAFGAAVSS